MSRKRKHLGWLVLALLLTAVSTLVMWNEAAPVAHRDSVDFPKQMRQRELNRFLHRRKALSLLTKSADASKRMVKEVDPLMVALSGMAKRGSYMVFELADLWETPIGAIIARCLEQAKHNPFEEMEAETGINVLSSIDRVAVANGLVLFDGDFDAENTPLNQNYSREEAGRTIRFQQPQGHKETSSEIAIWDNTILMVGAPDGPMAEALSLLNGELPYDPQAIPSKTAYGAIYGQMDVPEITEMFKEQRDFSERFADLMESVELHIDAGGDVAMVATARAWEGENADELAQSLGGIISLARLKARSDGEEELAALLDFAKVEPFGTGFTLEAALPLSFLEKHLSDCEWVGDSEGHLSPRDTETLGDRR